jgi:deoxyribodipyrimidine photolyase-related protein
MYNMKKYTLIIFPDQLFDPSNFSKYPIDSIHIIEHPIYFGKRRNMRPMTFNKKKILLHRASILAYIDELKTKGTWSIKHFLYESNTILSKSTTYLVFDPIDQQLYEELGKYNITILDSPAFLNTNEDLLPYVEESKRFSHASFYRNQIERHNIPYVRETTDNENRDAIPREMNKFSDFEIINNSKYVSKAIEFVEREFPSNYGTTDEFWIPITRNEAIRALDKFLKERLPTFGKFQDAIVPHEQILYHSLLSPLLNIGLLTPKYVIERVSKYYNRSKSIPYNSYEGFIRQIVGWREYQRMIYIMKGKEMRESNYFKNKRKLTVDFYKGTTGIEPVDDAIHDAFNYGYLNHIIRLMVMSNFMNLCEIHPDEVYRWFMEFAVDSYDWVMVGNVYSMGLWADKGLTMRKPYLSTGNYIEKMSGRRYKNSDEWAKKWRALYYVFLSKKSSQLNSTPYQIRSNVNMNEFKKIVKTLHFL